MEAMTGLSLDRTWISRHMRSLASASPPGESTRKTTALMFCSDRTQRWVVEPRSSNLSGTSGWKCSELYNYHRREVPDGSVAKRCLCMLQRRMSNPIHAAEAPITSARCVMPSKASVHHYARDTLS